MHLRVHLYGVDYPHAFEVYRILCRYVRIIEFVFKAESYRSLGRQRIRGFSEMRAVRLRRDCSEL